MATSMTAALLQDALADELRHIFNGFRLKSPSGGFAEINVFEQFLPVPKSAAPQEGDLDPMLIEEGLAASDVQNEPEPFPYIIVRLEEGKVEHIDDIQTVNVYLLVGVYDDDLANQGHKDVLNIFQKIYERFSKSPMLDHRYECDTSTIDWVLQDEESFPYFFGGMELNFFTLPIRREDPYA